MISNLEVRNFQSLQKVDLEMGPFTVIVGQSSSGKSALVRAISTLVSNKTGTDFISHGTTTSVITAALPEGKVSLSRSTTPAKNKYTIIGPDGEAATFTKLNRTTPEEVSEFLRIDSKDTVVLAGQFDKPFLLADSPAQAAQILGELTNVSLIFESSREANRQRLNSSGVLKTKATDLEGVEQRLAAFEGLQERQEALEAAEVALAKAEGLQKRIDRLNGLIAVLRDTKVAIAQADAALSVEVPAVESIETAHNSLVRFETIIRNLKDANASIKQADADWNLHQDAAVELSTQYELTLHEMGTCPTCGQSVVG